MNEKTRSDGMDDRDLERLLGAVGARVQPSAEAMAAARAAVEAEWRATVAARGRRQRTVTWAAAAGIAVAAVAVWIARPLVGTGGGPVAAMARVVGDVQRDGGDGRWAPLGATDSITAGSSIRTGADGRAALRLRDGVELRLDSGTVLAFEDSSHARLDAGAVYVDAGVGSGSASAAFSLETPAGDVRHLGTQYEARIADGALRVAIREGRVEIAGHGGKVRGDAGEQLVLQQGRVVRSRLAPTADEWSWVAAITPPFAVEGRSVDAFLAWVARETGRTIVYATPGVAQRAREVALRGSVEGLTPDEAVVAVLSTTSLRPTLEAERIFIE